MEDTQPTVPTRTPINLAGQTLRIPNLDSTFSHWNRGVNAKYSHVKAFIEAQLERVVPDPVVLKKAKAGDLGFFTSCWLPDATAHDVLDTAALFCIWVFFWDDAVDAAGVVSAERYRDESLRFVRYHLFGPQQQPGNGAGHGEGPVAPNAVCGLFAEVARRARAVCNGDGDKVEGFYDTVEAYMNACVEEAWWRAKGELPSVEEFYGFRLQTAAAEMFLDLSGMLNCVSLPGDIAKSRELREMRTCANTIAIVINEIFSLKKELKDGTPLNLVPITMKARGVDLATATAELVDSLHAHVRSFDDSTALLREEVVSRFGTEVQREVDRLVAAYQAMVTCVLSFSANSPRYRILQDRREDGSFVVVL